MLLSPSVDFFKSNLFKNSFQEHYHSVKLFGSWSGPTLCRTWSESKLFAKVISRRHMSPLARKYLILVYLCIFHLSANVLLGAWLHYGAKLRPLYCFHTVADPEGIQGVRSNPLPPHLFKYPIKMKEFLFHGIIKKNEINSPPFFIHMNPISRNPGSAPVHMPVVCDEVTCETSPLRTYCFVSRTIL